MLTKRFRRICKDSIAFFFEIAIERAIYLNSKHGARETYCKNAKNYCFGWVHNDTSLIAPDCPPIIVRFAWTHQTIWEGINIGCRRFYDNITCNSSIDTSWRNILAWNILYIVTAGKEVESKYKYVYQAAKLSINIVLLTPVPESCKRIGACRGPLRRNSASAIS